ncbi:predicted protein [Chaetoceros tenuissimus]|uniref:Uncharacterized protein n=1 Tax=Chaetoceros tenuissimus TaxID=426638 RepID=A0AAD3HAC7_9STRA|nr:predicted protein [Chaetoceros tenuissimus]
MTKDGSQKQSWLARNAVTEDEYIHYVRLIRDEIEIEQSASMPNHPQYMRTRKYTNISVDERMALTYMDPNASKEEVDSIIDMERGLYEAQLAKGRMSLKQFIEEKYLVDIYKGKSREGHHNGPIHYMNCSTYWSNCNIM